MQKRGGRAKKGDLQWHTCDACGHDFQCGGTGETWLCWSCLHRTRRGEVGYARSLQAFDRVWEVRDVKFRDWQYHGDGYEGG